MQSSIHRSADATLDYAGRFIMFNGSAGYSNMQVIQNYFRLPPIFEKETLLVITADLGWTDNDNGISM